MAKKFLLLEKEETSMVSCWADALYCSVLKDGSLSLRLNVKDEYGSEWLPAVRNIKTPEQFIDAFHSIERLENWSLEEIFPSIRKNLPTFAMRLTQFQKQRKNENVINASVKIKGFDVFYNYVKPKSTGGLNDLGKHYRSNHIDRQINLYLESYFNEGKVPKIGDRLPLKIFSNRVDLEISITNVVGGNYGIN